MHHALTGMSSFTESRAQIDEVKTSPITDLVAQRAESALPDHHRWPEGPLPQVTSAILQLQTGSELPVITSRKQARPRCRVFCKRKPSTSQNQSTSWLCVPSFLGPACSALPAVLYCLLLWQTPKNRTLLWPLLATELVSQLQVQHSDFAICPWQVVSVYVARFATLL